MQRASRRSLARVWSSDRDCGDERESGGARSMRRWKGFPRAMRSLVLVSAFAVALGVAADSGQSGQSAGGPVLLYASDWLGPTRLFAADPSGKRPLGQVTFHRLRPYACGSAWACGIDDPTASPDGRSVAYVDSGDLW